TALLNSACVEARLRSAESIVLEVAVDNSAALGLYARRGFLPVGRRRNYYSRTRETADAHVLRLALSGTSTPTRVGPVRRVPVALLTGSADCPCRRFHH